MFAWCPCLNFLRSVKLSTASGLQRMAQMGKSVLEAIALQGYALLHAEAPDLPSVEALARFGKTLNLTGLAGVQVLRPLEKEESFLNTYSGNFGHGEFPLHTDLAHWYRPPRFLALRCIVGKKEVATRLLDGRLAMAQLGASALTRALVLARRPLANSRPLLRMLDDAADDGPLLRWDSLFITPATQASAQTFEAMRSFVATAKPQEIVLGQPGDTLLIDNWRMLHGRSRIAATAVQRRIERVYIDELHLQERR